MGVVFKDSRPKKIQDEKERKKSSLTRIEIVSHQLILEQRFYTTSFQSSAKRNCFTPGIGILPLLPFFIHNTISHHTCTFFRQYFPSYTNSIFLAYTSKPFSSQIPPLSNSSTSTFPSTLPPILMLPSILTRTIFIIFILLVLSTLSLSIPAPGPDSNAIEEIKIFVHYKPSTILYTYNSFEFWSNSDIFPEESFSFYPETGIGKQSGNFFFPIVNPLDTNIYQPEMFPGNIIFNLYDRQLYPQYENQITQTNSASSSSPASSTTSSTRPIFPTTHHTTLHKNTLIKNQSGDGGEATNEFTRCFAFHKDDRKDERNPLFAGIMRISGGLKYTYEPQSQFQSSNSTHNPDPQQQQQQQPQTTSHLSITNVEPKGAITFNVATLIPKGWIIKCLGYTPDKDEFFRDTRLLVSNSAFPSPRQLVYSIGNEVKLPTLTVAGGPSPDNMQALLFEHTVITFNHTVGAPQEDQSERIDSVDLIFKRIPVNSLLHFDFIVDVVKLQRLDRLMGIEEDDIRSWFSNWAFSSNLFEKYPPICTIVEDDPPTVEEIVPVLNDVEVTSCNKNDQNSNQDNLAEIELQGGKKVLARKWKKIQTAKESTSTARLFPNTRNFRDGNSFVDFVSTKQMGLNRGLVLLTGTTVKTEKIVKIDFFETFIDNETGKLKIRG